MLAEGVGIGQVVLEGDVVAGVALLAHGVVTPLPATKVNLGFVGGGLGIAHIETDLAAEDEMLHRGQLGVDVSGEFLPLEEVLIQHGQGHRVGGSVAFTDCGGIIAIEVIYRNIRQGREGVEDDTLLTVSELHVIVGDSVGGVQTELEPILELSVQVGAERHAVEVRADNGSLLVHVGTGDIVLDLLGTALGADLVLVLESGAEDLVLPVGSLSEDGRIGVVGVCLDLADSGHIVVIFSEFPQVHHVDPAGLAAHGEHSVIGELRLAGLTVLGGDEDDTVGALRSVDRCRRGVLQDLHRDDVGRVDGGQRGDRGDLTVSEATETEIASRVASALDDHTVDNVERLSVGVDSRLSTDTDG